MSSINKEKTTADGLLKFSFDFDYSNGPVAISVTISCPKTDEPPSSPPSSSSSTTPQTLQFANETQLAINLTSSGEYHISGDMRLVPLSVSDSGDDAGVWVNVSYGEHMYRHFEGTAVTYQSSL